MTDGRRFDAVIFDLGGVVLESPMHVIVDYEIEHGIEPGSVNSVVVDSGDGGAWARHERGELERSDFLRAFAGELLARGLTVDTGALMALIEESFQLRPRMVEAIARIRSAGLTVAAITNNWTPFDPDGVPELFDVFLESVTEGVRKPEPEIYRRCLRRLGVAPDRAVMLDDLGPNLKPARSMGMATIKVVSVRQGLAELEALLDMRLLGEHPESNF